MTTATAKKNAIRKARLQFGEVRHIGNGAFNYSAWSHGEKTFHHPLCGIGSRIIVGALRNEEIAREAACIILGYTWDSAEYAAVQALEFMSGNVEQILDGLLAATADMSRSRLSKAI